MTPKEKARELFTIYRFVLSKRNAPLGNQKDLIAKQCALIAVDEIEEALTDYGKGDSLELQNMDSTFRYWWKVKQEIEKL